MSKEMQNLAVLILFVCSAARIGGKNTSGCVPSSCGDIVITYPFRLRGDPPNCGHSDTIFMLDCHENRTTMKTKSRSYRVQEISYRNFSARISDPGVDSHNYSSCPIYFSSDVDILSSYISVNYDNHVDVAFFKCRKPVNNPLYVESPFCSDTSARRSNVSRDFYTYVAASRILVSELEESCTYDAVTEASFPSTLRRGNYTYSQVHDLMAYGFELSWKRVLCVECEDGGGTCSIENNGRVRCRRYCYEDTPLSERSFVCKLDYYLPYIMIAVFAIGGIIGLRFLLGITMLIALMWHRYRAQDCSSDNREAVEELSRLQTNGIPINYSYREIEKMTRNFEAKIGEGNRGSVFAGKLKSGPPVAIKVFKMSSINDRDFVSIVSKMAKINHLNSVKLIGFCIEGSRRAFVHELAKCGTLASRISSLTCRQILRICRGTALGIEYLHGAEVPHLGIEPSNILLDEDFNPKIKDRGIKDVTATGYAAPELFYKHVGDVSCKADVYSFGMVMMEMAGKLRVLKSGETDFPLSIYERLNKGKRMEIDGGDEEEEMRMKRMVMVALRCVQIRPQDRPSMNEVVGMFDEQIESLQLPPNPFRASVFNDM
ncbi:LEAF RUST 10 DISEASE-RESISTANCE LOCUS RECEPTOR-LIKE PROTEIN KINASE-like 2.2 isoform X1 [Andrographis paniculata]|uniref:LEAF RUST 10 DISEASE-RESISTANCE LOCUS RECEPTOR-LIKE PROTEIN KINASE-like 2.2 isoform X1 n=1 Tax=Andrographis paniculata TaxID=175694 RepID=UPI0021E7A084|nr:LEAF RUST 10 DISEASE-RESISTANCE LOCUS RECEPTOR-LIKE PROTEIN KINASE-like 2.2 isoform X1 [Andrographis paniculata]